MKKLTLDKVVEYVLILAITMVLVLIGNCINTITDGNPDTFISVLDGIPGMLILFGIALVSLCIAQYTPKIPAINVERCIGCGACEHLCPSRPQSAIYVEGHEMHRSI